jgi:methylmalonyl-CoA/ethylmalonyl-CoA epimerase
VTAHLDHVALVVPRLEACLERLAGLGLAIGPIEDFPGEGTREVYVGAAEQPAKLLLMQPTDPAGPYGRALARRGPGLHHLAVRVPDLAAALRELGGWLLHPASVDSIAACRTAWLARPGVGTLVEVTEGEAGSPVAGPVVEAVRVPAAGCEELLAASVGGRSLGVEPAGDGRASLTLAGQAFDAAALAAP